MRRVVFPHHHPVAHVGRHVDLCGSIQLCHAYQETVWILVNPRFVAAVLELGNAKQGTASGMAPSSTKGVEMRDIVSAAWCDAPGRVCTM